MTAAPTTTPNSADITPRRMDFDYDLLQEKYFFRDNCILSTFQYALSGSFPDGERFFIDSVRHYQKDIQDPVLKAQTRGFIGQEAHHTHAHEQFNNAVEDKFGLVMGRIVKRIKKRLNYVRTNATPGMQLAVTAAVEHITATLAQWVLEHPELTNRDTDSPLREMLIWHAMEEIEHKAVAFDVYRTMVDDETQRIAVAKLVFRTFWIQMAISQVTLLWHDRKLPTLREIREAWDFMWGKNGIRRWAAPEFAKYLRKGFHPNDIDQIGVIAHWREQYPEVAELQIA